MKTLTLLSPHPLAPAVELKGGEAPVEEDLKTKVKQTTRFRTIYYAYDLDTMDVLDNLAPYAEDYYDN